MIVVDALVVVSLTCWAVGNKVEEGEGKMTTRLSCFVVKFIVSSFGVEVSIFSKTSGGKIRASDGFSSSIVCVFTLPTTTASFVDWTCSGVVVISGTSVVEDGVGVSSVVVVCMLFRVTFVFGSLVGTDGVIISKPTVLN